jgi:ABC transporter substrate binding protein
MRRRAFIIGGAAAAWPLAARAQQGERMRRIGVLMGNAESDSGAQAGLVAFTSALQELGWTDNRDIRIDHRWAAADVDRMRTFAKELVSLSPDLILAQTTSVVAALQRETSTIPIVFVVVSDPVGSGFVASLPRPGGNITGFINIESSLSGKWIGMLKDIVPGITRAVLMFNPETAPYFDYYLQPFEAAARSYAVEPITAPIRTAADIERLVTSVGERLDTGVVVMPDVFTGTLRNLNLIISLAARHRVPTLPISVHGCSGRPDFLRNRPARSLSASRRLCRSRSQGREACRASGPAAYPVRTGRESQDREGARPRSPPRRCSPAPTR